MQQKLTISIDEQVYRGLHQVIGRGKIAKFLENLARPFVVEQALSEAYQQIAADEIREAEANEWTEAFAGEVGDEAW